MRQSPLIILASAMMVLELYKHFEGHPGMTQALDDLTAKIEALPDLVTKVQGVLAAAVAEATTQDPAIVALSAKVDSLTAQLQSLLPVAAPVPAADPAPAA